MTDGVLVVDKHDGRTSRQVVNLVLKALRARKAGHLGTLDPFATGVLPVCLGKATRLARFLSHRGKSYTGVLLLGETSDTHDRTGRILTRAEVPPEIDFSSISQALKRFEGTIEQIPPMYSARKVGGKRLYSMARQGISVERQPTTITIHRLELIELRGRRASFSLRCSAGTYVRSLARDLGQMLACGALVESLRRTSADPFSLAQSVDQDLLEDDAHRETLLEMLIPLDAVDLGMPELILEQAELLRILHGTAIPCPASLVDDESVSRSDPGGFVALRDPGGGLAAVARVVHDTSSMIRPVVVLPTEAGPGPS